MLALLRNNPRFARLWSAQVVSALGDWFNRIAVLALIGQLGGTGEQVGVGLLFALEYALRMLPTATFSPLAGALADRLSRKAIMIAADLLRCLVVLCLLFVNEPGELPLLYALIFGQMSVSIFFDSARSGALPNTVRREDLHAAYALSAVTWSTMLAVGAFLGGALVERIGIQAVFALDALTYLVSAGFLITLVLPPTPVQPQAFRLSDVLLLTDLRRGFAHVRQLGIWPILFSKVLWSPCGGFLVLFPLLAATYDGSAGEALDLEAAGATIGLFFGARGVGTGLGPLVARRLWGSNERALVRMTWGGMLVGALGYLCLVFAPNLPLALAAVTLAHMGGSAQWVGSTTYWQRRIDDAFRGRVFATEFLLMTLSFSVFAFAGGLMYDLFGDLRPVYLVLVGAALVGALVGRSWFRQLPTGERPSPQAG
ncbi:MAG: MFS transporter [Planctomycetota bacterium]|nr:MFS transporter [Planctomycetota bacterium]